MTDLPIIDVDSPDGARRFVGSIRNTGFAVLAGYPALGASAADVAAEWLAVFATDSKFAYAAPPGGQLGYFAVDEGGGEIARDRKEYFHVRPGGPYPESVSAAALVYFDAVLDLARTLLRWLDEALPAHVIERRMIPLPEMVVSDRATTLRVQHYLPVPGASRGAIRALAHEDINLITLLPAPTVPGLQVKDVDGVWHNVSADPDAMVVNAGQVLQAATCGHYPATPHRVVVVTEEDAAVSRVSMPLFVHADSDAVLPDGRTVGSFISEEVDRLARMGWRSNPGGVRSST